MATKEKTARPRKPRLTTSFRMGATPRHAHVRVNSDSYCKTTAMVRRLERHLRAEVKRVVGEHDVLSLPQVYVLGGRSENGIMCVEMGLRTLPGAPDLRQLMVAAGFRDSPGEFKA